MKFQPLNGYVVLEKKEPEKVSGGGIILPNANEIPTEGKVVAIAGDVEGNISLGNTVLFKQYSGTEFKIEGRVYLLILAKELLGKFL